MTDAAHDRGFNRRLACGFDPISGINYTSLVNDSIVKKRYDVFYDVASNDKIVR